MVSGDMQIDVEAYRRAERVFDPNLAGLLRNGRVVPRWLGEGRAFWYARAGQAGLEAVRIDPDGTATPIAPPPPEPAAPTDRLPSPSGDRSLIVRGDDLWLVDEDGQERRLTFDGEPDFPWGKPADSALMAIPRRRSGRLAAPVNVSWSPDGRTLAGFRVDQRAVEPYPFVEWVPLDGGFRPVRHDLRVALTGDAHEPVQAPYLIDVDSGRVTPMSVPSGWQVEDPAFAWAADGRRLFVLLLSSDARAVALAEVDRRTGAIRMLIEEHGPTRTVFNSFIYSAPNVRVLGGGREAVWFAERDGWGHLYLYDLATGAVVRRLTAGPWLVRDIVHVDEARRRLFFTAMGREPGRDPYYRCLYRVSLDGGEPVLLTPEDAEHEIDGPMPEYYRAIFGMAPFNSPVSPDGVWFIDTWSTVDTPPVTALRSTEDGSVVRILETADASAVFAAGWRPPERVSVVAADGSAELWAVVYLPPGHEPGRRYPVIDAIYGGPQMINTPRSFAEAVQTGNPVARSSLAELGFIVITLDGRGTPGRSKAFHDVGHDGFADPQIEDHAAAIAQLAERYGTFDLERVGVYGHSFGGYVSARAILARPDVYKVAVSSAGSHNFHGFYSGLKRCLPMPDYGGGSALRPGPDAVPDNYRRLDNASLAANLKGKLLLVYGDLDENALPAVTHQLADALIRANRRFDMLVLPNRDHGFFRTDPYFVQRLWDYFVEHLAGVEPPDGFDLAITPGGNRMGV